MEFMIVEPDGQWTQRVTPDSAKGAVVLHCPPAVKEGTREAARPSKDVHALLPGTVLALTQPEEQHRGK